jgi:hypothetical protein
MVTLAVVVLFLGCVGLMQLAVRAARGVRRVLAGSTPDPRSVAQAHHI